MIIKVKMDKARLKKVFSRNGKGSLRDLQEIYRLIDKDRDALERDIGVPICVTCGRCCESTSVTADGIETEFIVQWLRRQKPAFRDKILEKCEEWLLAKDEHVGFYHGIGTIGMTTDEVDRLQSEGAHLVFRTACPMLEDSRCLIYPVRPLVCRTYGVTRTTPTNICTRPLGKAEGEFFRGVRNSEFTKRAKEKLASLQKPEGQYRQDRIFVATAIYIHLRPERFWNILYHNEVASGRLVRFKIEQILWQSELDEHYDRESEMAFITHPVPLEVKKTPWDPKYQEANPGTELGGEDAEGT